jgi:hypothetical protein
MDTSNANVAVATDVANATFKSGTKYTANIKGFRYGSIYAFLIVTLQGKDQSLIVGEKVDNPIRELVALKGLSADFTFKQYKTVNDVEYPQFTLDCIVL